MANIRVSGMRQGDDIRHTVVRRFVSASLLGACLTLSVSLSAWAGAQKYEPLAASVKARMSKAVADAPINSDLYDRDPYLSAWVAEMSDRLIRYVPDEVVRLDLLKTVHYEATRAGLDPELILGLMEVESGFRKYAVSSVGARGFMQIMPFWADVIGTRDHNLFHLRTNLRYGCTILRHYLDIERGDLYRALGRYNGSLGQPQYPSAVHAAWRKHWTYGLTPVGLKSSKGKTVRKGT
ncbi:MAG TPA: lytic transglycosylase domain-containing protein [Thiobacillaceae bacterium]|nr:lytic transglycosylase domain-containing protein [Thiobacillaceae bacterium]